MATVINLFGGPGTGKTTAALEITRRLKIRAKPTVFVAEFAQELVLEKRENTIRYQPYVTMKQWRNIQRAADTVEYVVTDGPILLGSLYGRKFNPDLPESYHQLLWDLHEKMNTMNIFLEREFAYETYGRYQSEAEAKALDVELLGMLQASDAVHVVPASKGVDYVMKLIGGESNE